MENMETQENTQNVEPKKKRPLFLTILCIISFLGIAYVLASTIYDYFTPSSSQNMLEKLAPLMGTMLDAFDTSTFLYFSKINKIISIIAAIICLPGVILMWRLKKAGFLFYLVGEISPVIAFFIFVLFCF